MSRNRRPARPNRPNRPPRERRPRTVDVWRPVPELAEPAPVERLGPEAVQALVRSLGTPPLPGQGAVADRYLAEVVARAAALATALATAADLVAEPGDDAE